MEEAMKSVIAVVVLLVCSANIVSAGAAPKDPGVTKACRKFLTAMLANDKEGVLSVILPAKDSDILWKGEPVPEKMLAEIAKVLKNLSVVELSEGEKFAMPNGLVLEIKKGMLNENKRFVLVNLLGSKTPLPLWVLKKNGTWKIDASGIIAGRKAAAKVRARREAEKRKKSQDENDAVSPD
jgi:hypothetical protein